MAKFNEGALISEIRGSIADQTYSKNAAGPYVKSKLTQTNPNTSYQQIARDYFAFITTQWRTLTDANRNAWIAKAKEENSHHNITSNSHKAGFNFFMSANYWPWAWNGIINAEPLEEKIPNPLYFDNLNPSYPTLSVRANGIDFTFEWLIILKITPPMSPGVMSLNRSMLSNLLWYDSNSDPQTFSLQPAYSTRFTIPVGVVGMAFWWQQVNVNMLSGKLYHNAPVKEIFTS